MDEHQTQDEMVSLDLETNEQRNFLEMSDGPSGETTQAYFGRSCAQRNPVLVSRFVGAPPSRTVGRIPNNASFQLPPRIIR